MNYFHELLTWPAFTNYLHELLHINATIRAQENKLIEDKSTKGNDFFLILHFPRTFMEMNGKKFDYRVHQKAQLLSYELRLENMHKVSFLQS